MAKDFGRNTRVSAQMQKELALLMQRDVKDPRLGMITVNDVVLSRDLATAKVYVTVLNADQASIEKNIDILNDASPFFRSELGKRMKMRIIPGLKFYYDDSLDAGMRVEALLKETDRESDS